MNQDCILDGRDRYFMHWKRSILKWRNSLQNKNHFIGIEEELQIGSLLEQYYTISAVKEAAIDNCRWHSNTITFQQNVACICRPRIGF